ncbi:unnamed protein product (macronuclear) [Paramecium tetraurelia]|uniref:Par3/HAL N-terminal domain-containing protein n=2 Tax=Paramecium TaxID=5884 RepID=A0BCE8_PARTE|nr:uncharacterized protein GSPATT00004309001 [Paramecium tetraurelia]CAD8138001.1 unnamed protein product [Paramecium octaurelia]CAK56215.1 unnamed protein product [Paramecium tetraurelia]|eukprot:XP_001423613.1 hypothetical protein (macronuclear) [Paramecium tetraurelia strain d4-2]
MKIEVHIKDKQFAINCGDGLQKVKWLGDVAIFRHSHFYSQINSTTKGIKLENGEMVDLNAIISSTLAENTHVWVVLKEDLEAMGMDTKQQQQQHKRPITAVSRRK